MHFMPTGYVKNMKTKKWSKPLIRIRKCGEKMYPRKFIGNLSIYTNDARSSKMNKASNSENLVIKIFSTAVKNALEFGGI